MLLSYDYKQKSYVNFPERGINFLDGDTTCSDCLLMLKFYNCASLYVQKMNNQN